MNNVSTLIYLPHSQLTVLENTKISDIVFFSIATQGETLQLKVKAGEKKACHKDMLRNTQKKHSQNLNRKQLKKMSITLMISLNLENPHQRIKN